jgi:SAM-dependent methyltransferase
MRDSQNTYFIDPTSGAEIARLVDQEHLFTEALGGLFPPEIEPDNITTVLNLGCGPGEWEHEVAFKHPHIIVVGVDLSETMVKYARALAQVARHDNVAFEVMDVKKPLAFADDSFDLVNGRLLFGFMDKESWPSLLSECLRVLRPGGMLCLTEYEVSISNSAALQYLLHCLYRALADQQRTFSVDRRSIGICHMLEKLLKEAGFVESVGRAFHIDSSYGKPHYYAGCRDTETALTLIKPYLLKAEVIEEAEYDALYNQMQIDMMGESFVNISFGLQVWGYKP